MSETRTVDVLDVKGGKSGTAELPAELFDVSANIPLIHQVVTAQLAAARQGTHATKSRGEARAAAANRTGRRAPAVPARARGVRHSSLAAASYTDRSHATTRNARPRR
jgi:ribosomal protein L4